MWINRRALLANRRDDPRMRMPDVGHGDPGGEVEETVAVHVLDHRPLRPPHHQRINPRVRRRHHPLVALEPGGASGPRQRSVDPRLVTVAVESFRLLPGDDSPGEVIRPGLDWNHAVRRPGPSVHAK